MLASRTFDPGEGIVMSIQTYGPAALCELADSKRGAEAHVATAGGSHGSLPGITGVALPDWVQAGAILTSDNARRLGAQLLVAADEHDAIQESGAR